ncbi:MAG: hypothetical protein CVT82_13645 [Alphaproteobacteria bacterium HGW-Alphaproteobacteria-4]|nr:MAG: hypothetical protein CVT82_13645 [Alphaproteobacteria bacterium HGW-Alphaproteobacteria-4]
MLLVMANTFLGAAAHGAMASGAIAELPATVAAMDCHSPAATGCGMPTHADDSLACAVICSGALAVATPDIAAEGVRLVLRLEDIAGAGSPKGDIPDPLRRPPRRALNP